MSDTRTTLLAAMFDMMSNYLIDECPVDANWENFDPNIDRLRAEVGDLLGCRDRLASLVNSTPARGGNRPVPAAPFP